MYSCESREKVENLCLVDIRERLSARWFSEPGINSAERPRLEDIMRDVSMRASAFPSRVEAAARLVQERADLLSVFMLIRG